MLSNLPGLLNVVLSTVIVLTLFYRRGESRHKPLMSWLAAADAALCLCAALLSVWSFSTR